MNASSASDPASSDDTPVAAVEPRRPVRVLFINDTARNGGPGRSLYYILKFLDTSRVHRTVVLPREGVISELYAREQVADELHFERTLVENPFEPWTRAMVRDDFDASRAVKTLRLVGNVGRGAVALARLRALAISGRYDLIYCNGTNACFAGGAIAATSKVPALWHVRYTSVPPAAEPIHDRLARGRNVTRIVCVSGASAALFPGLEDKVRVIHNALDAEEFDSAGVVPAMRAELAIPEDAIVFGSQGRVLPRKGYVEMIRAARIMMDELPAALRGRVRFVVLGDTPEDIRPNHLEECRALVRELGLGASFQFVGFKVDVKPYVADFDVAVVPSVYPDPLPRAVIESMAMGKPVVGFDVGGVSEMLADGETGTLVSGSPPDVAGLARAMARYAEDEALRRAHGAAGRRRVERAFDARLQARRIQNEIVRAARLTAP